MSNPNLANILRNINEMLSSSAKILIVVSKPIDPDCIGTALSLSWLLNEKNKSADIISFTNPPLEMTSFPGIDAVAFTEPKIPDFHIYDTVILVDGCDWAQFLGDNWKEVLTNIDKQKIINLDHHMPGDILKAIPETCLNSKTSCTAQLLYEAFIEPEIIKIPPHVAEYLYLALLYDSGNFKYEIYPGQYSFAEKLIASGADHAKAMDINYDKKEIDFMVWAIEHTEFLPEYKLSMLIINKELNIELQKIFGESWSDYDKFYKEAIERQIKGYDYGIILMDNLNNSIRFGWRTRNYGDTTSIADLARKSGFNAGGHRNAGGGKFEGTIEEAKENLLREFKKLINKS
jgi:phosphoesterase RecJ-like protein